MMMMMMMMMMMVMMNCFCGMVYRRKTFNLISSRDGCQRYSPLQISDVPQAGIKAVLDLSSDFILEDLTLAAVQKYKGHWSILKT